MEAPDVAGSGVASLDVLFSVLEHELQRHLWAFLQSKAEASNIASHDVRLMLQGLSKRWDDSGTGRGPPERTLRLKDSPIIAANFYTIHTVLNCYHHKTPTHWDVIEQGFDSAVRLLRALRTHAGIDTSESVSRLLAKWQAVEKVGDSAYDHTLKIVVEDITYGDGALGSSAAPTLLLKNLPAEASPSLVMWALQAQDVNVTEAMIHLANDGEAGAEPYVELNSAEEQRELLDLGSITIKKTKVQLAKPEETREVVLYLPKRLPTQAIAAAWENEFDHVLADDHIRPVDSEGQVVVVRLTPEQFAEVEGREILLLRTQVKLLRWTPHAVKLQLPSAEMPTEGVRSAVASQAEGEADQIEELVHLATHRCAFVHLRSAATKARLLQKRYLEVIDPASVRPSVPATAGSPAILSSATGPAVSDSQPQAMGPQAASEPKAATTARPEQPSSETIITSPEGKTLVLSPLLPGVTVEQVAEMMRVGCGGIDAKFVTIRDGKAYVQYSPSADSGTVTARQTINHNGNTIQVEPFVGEIPCWKLGVRSGPSAHPTIHVVGPQFIRTLRDTAPLQVGQCRVFPVDVAVVEIGTKECFEKALSSHDVVVGGVALTLFDARLDRTEQLAGAALVYYLTQKKKGLPTVKKIEQAHAVTITTWWVFSPASLSSSSPSSAAPVRAAGRTKVSVVRIVGKSAGAVDLAWKKLRDHLATVVRKKLQFRFDKDEALVRACFRYKLKSLFWKGATTAVHVDDLEEEDLPLVVHVVGPNAQEVDMVALESNRIRTRLVFERSPSVLVPGQTKLDLPELEKTFDVAVAADWKARQLKVVGYRDSVSACLAHVHALVGSTRATPVTSASVQATAAGGVKGGSGPAQAVHTKTTGFVPAEAAAVQRLNLSVVKSKFGVHTKVDLAKRTITFTGSAPAALNAANGFVRWFITNGTRPGAAPVPAASATGGPGATTKGTPE